METEQFLKTLKIVLILALVIGIIGAVFYRFMDSPSFGKQWLLASLPGFY
jgi:zona occludens toxin (predicted ATPase)